MTTMEYQTPTNDGPRPNRPGKPKIRLPLDPVHGRRLAREMRQLVEDLRSEAKETSGAAVGVIMDRAWFIELFVVELEAFHGIEAE